MSDDATKKISYKGKTEAVIPPDATRYLFCPLCPAPSFWFMNEGFTSRKRLGEHIGNCHREQVVLPAGVLPHGMNTPHKEKNNADS